RTTRSSPASRPRGRACSATVRSSRCRGTKTQWRCSPMSERTPISVLAPKSQVPTISRRSALAGFGVLGLGALSACGATTKMAESPAPDGEIESKLNLYSWGDYDSPDLLGTFNDDFDVLLQVDSYGSNEELIAKLSSSRGTSGYDVV